MSGGRGPCRAARHVGAPSPSGRRSDGLWLGRSLADPTRGKVAWEGENKLSRVKLFLTTWANPDPGKQGVAIDYVATRNAPFCVAITAEE